jgi:hypothetical protein
MTSIYDLPEARPRLVLRPTSEEAQPRLILRPVPGVDGRPERPEIDPPVEVVKFGDDPPRRSWLGLWRRPRQQTLASRLAAGDDF